ncbi:hypothetical protein R1sor_014648 [Riccia sorocarpa]|uniref:Uncharacterized protein n=1 Tax=Riccia sorocarpa TaxID=122646 RepID=A0ABD3HG42_9MARC
MAPKKRRGSEITAARSPVRRSLRRTVVDVPPDRRGGGESSRGTVRPGRDVGGRGGHGRGRGCTTHGEAASESKSDSAGDVPEPIDPLGRPRRPLRRRIVEDIFPEEEEPEPEPEPEEGALPRRQVRENPLPEGPYRVSWIPIIDRTRTAPEQQRAAELSKEQLSKEQLSNEHMSNEQLSNEQLSNEQWSIGAAASIL